MSKSPNGNNFWKECNLGGRPESFSTPEELRDACISYFEWIVENPMHDYKQVLVNSDGEAEETIAAVPKMKPMLIKSLCTYIGISKETWNQYKNKPKKAEQTFGFSEVKEWASNIIYDQKYSGASIGMFNANIISRELGLIDRRETDHKGSLELSDLSEEALDRKIRELQNEIERSTED